MWLERQATWYDFVANHVLDTWLPLTRVAIGLLCIATIRNFHANKALEVEVDGNPTSASDIFSAGVTLLVNM
eukprot:SAG31_NODE_20181_length_581_cov_1.493776_1_plen_71_part_01